MKGAQFSVGRVEGVPFTACTSGQDIIILASNFSRVQQITAKSHISSLDCSTDVGKIAAAYDTEIIIFDPIPQQQNQVGLKWIQTATIQASCKISVMSFNLEGTKLIVGGQTLQLWTLEKNNEWQCKWCQQIANQVTYLKFSPDGNLFCSASKSDRLVKIWYKIYNSYSFVYLAHPVPITGLEWRRSSTLVRRHSKPQANVLITSCSDNIARIWIQTYVTKPGVHLHLAASIENTEVVHWINNKDMHITRSIESLLHGMLTRILKGSQSAGESCSGSENDTNDTLTAESSKKLRHKLCRKVNKQRALAASGRRDIELDENGSQPNQTGNGRTSPTSLVDEFDRSLESLLKRWQTSADLLFSINKSDGSLTIWQVNYIDGEDTGVSRQVQIAELSCVKTALSHYDATTMSLNVVAYSPSAYLEVKRAYIAVTNSTTLGTNCMEIFGGEQFTPVEVSEISSSNADQTNNNPKPEGCTLSNDAKDSMSASSITESEPSIFIVTQHLSGILSLWKLNFETNYPKVQSIDLVTRITGLPIDPTWLRDGILKVEFDKNRSAISTEWIPDENSINLTSKLDEPISPWRSINYSFDFEGIKSSQPSQFSSIDGESSAKLLQPPNPNQSDDDDDSKDSFRASQIASVINLMPQYHPKQLIELLAFGKLQRVKAILNHLVDYLLSLDSNPDSDDKLVNPAPWSRRSRTLSIVGNSSSFHDSFDIDNPTSTIQQQVIEEIELDYIEVKSIKPLPLYQLLEADSEKPNTGDSVKSNAKQEFSVQDYENFMPIRSQVDETLDEILGQSAIDTLNRQKSLRRKSQSPEEASLTIFNPRKAKQLTRSLTHAHLPGLTNIDQMHLLAVADAVALFDASPNDYENYDEDAYENANDACISTNIAIDSLDDRGLRFLTAMGQYVYLTRCLPMKQRNELQASGIGNHNIVWAFHSDSQEELISLIPCVSRNKPEWSELREYGLGWWVKKLEVLKKLIEKVAQSAYQARQDPLDAALFYLAMKKKTLVCALLRRVNCDKRLLKLFEQDFNDPVVRKKALKNAYALLGLHRFEHAAAFFILAGSIWDAVEVCINNLNDIQLAIVLIRLYDSDSNVPNNLKRLLTNEVLESSNPDPFLRSIAYWKLSDHLSAVHTLLETGPSINASVFNFYLFLKSQPLVLKQQQNLSEETTADKERFLFFSTAHSYLEVGSPILALEVLCSKDNMQSNTSKAQRMKFMACLHLLMNELKTLTRDQFRDWLKRSVDAMEKICSYYGDSNHEALLRTMLTYCNFHSANENSLTNVRSELLDLLNKK